MDLLIDIGNSRIKWAAFDGQGLQAPGQAIHADRGLAPAATRSWAKLPPPRRVLTSTVARGEKTKALQAWARSQWGLEVEPVHAQPAAYGVRNAYRDPEQLGSDRWAVLLAARAETDRGAFIVDCGTAITIDVLRADGQHLGGLIGPGLATMRSALARGTGNLGDTADQELTDSTLLLTASTRDALVAGTLYAAVGFVEHTLERIYRRHGASIQPIITGGDAPRLLPHLTASFRHDPHFVLKGLAIIAGSSP